MATLSTGKIVANYFDKVIETYEHQMDLLDMVEFFKPGSADMQNAGNTVWRNVQQHAPIINGWDLTGQQTGVIQETYPADLGEPANDFWELRADDLRDPNFWENRAEQSGMKQVTELNSRIASMIKDTGSLFYRTDATSGYDAIAQGQAILNERQKLRDDQRYCVLNDRDNLKYGQDLAGRQTLQGRPEETWNTGQIGRNVAQFDVYTGSYLPVLTGGAVTDSTVDTAVSEKPEGGTKDPVTRAVTNVDYRTSGDILLSTTNPYVVGDIIKFDNGGTDVQSIGLADKNPSGQAMTFKVVYSSGLNIRVFPKPIALDDAALSTLEKAYANIDTQIGAGAGITKLNIDTSKKINPFWCKKSLEVTGGDAPVELLNEFGGMKVISSTMKNGQNMYMAYDGNISTMNFVCRLFTWYGLTNADPSANGVFVTF